jgi:hypothetical protein
MVLVRLIGLLVLVGLVLEAVQQGKQWGQMQLGQVKH